MMDSKEAKRPGELSTSQQQAQKFLALGIGLVLASLIRQIGAPGYITVFLAAGAFIYSTYLMVRDVPRNGAGPSLFD